MKRTVTVIGMLAISAAAFWGFGKLAETADQPKGFDPKTIPDVVEYTAGIPRDTVIANVDGQPIAAENYLYWLSYVTELVQYYQFQGGDIDWTQEVDGMPLSDYLKAQALESSKLYRVVETKAEELGCGFNEDNEAAYQESYDALVAQQGSEEAVDKWLLQICLNREGFKSINKVRFLYENIQASQTDSSPASAVEVADYIEANDMLRAKHILLSSKDLTTNEELSDEEKAAKKEQAEELLEQLRQSGDPTALFDTLMSEYSEDPGWIYYPDGYDFTAGEMVAPFEQGTRELEYGEISDVIESDFGYHIILRLDPATDELAAQLGQARGEEEIDALMTDWLADAQVETTQAYEDLDVAAFYDKLLALRDEIYETDAAAQAATAEPTPAEAG